MGARAWAGTVVHDGRFWVLGGWSAELTNSKLYNDIWSSADGQAWERVARSAPWSRRSFHGALSFANQMWVLGGYHFVQPTHVLGDVWSSGDGRSWKLATEAPGWSARENFGSAVFNKRMFVLGGCTYGPPFHCLSDVWSSADGVHWDEVTRTAPWGERRGFGCVAFAGRLWLVGGWDSSHRLCNDVWCSPDGANWDCLAAHAPWAPRGGFPCTVFDNAIWCLGGHTLANHDGDYAPEILPANDVWLSRDGQSWTQMSASAPWKPRGGCSLFVDERAGVPRLWLGHGLADKRGTRRAYQDIWCLEKAG